MIKHVLAAARRSRSWLILKFSRGVRSWGRDVHVGSGSAFWAPDQITIGAGVYFGKNVSVQCNASIGDYVLIANNVAFVGRNDHEFRRLGVPVRFSPWIGRPERSPHRDDLVVIESDVWVGYGAIVLTGVRVGRGAVIAAGAVVIRDVDPYSIVGGNPAREIGRRFKDDDLHRHELSIRTGVFLLSERGYEHWVVQPGVDSDSGGKS